MPRKGFSAATAELGEDCTGGVRKRTSGKGVCREHQGRRGRRGSGHERGWRKGERGCRSPGGVEWEKVGQGQMVPLERWSNLS